MTPPTPQLPQLVKQARERLATLLREHDKRAADQVDKLLARRDDTPSIVVVGETNRGKSSLVNALIATPGLSPVDADVATATYLVLRHGPQWTASAGYAEPIDIPIEDVGRWVTGGEQQPPRHVDVRAPIPLLQRLSIVDTPGVGGLNSMHGELAAEAAATATALLFVVDASAPFTKGELDFLATVGERVETVLFALTKVDQFRGWREILDANQRLLAEHAPRFAGAKFHAVSPRMFEMAAKAPNPDAAGMLRERSGVGELQVAVQELVVGRSLMLAEANALRTLTTAIGEVEVRLRASARALDTGHDEADALRARRDRLAADRKSSTRSWQVKLRTEIQRARLESLHEVSRQIRDAQSWFRQAIDAADRDALAALPQQLDAALQVISARVNAVLADRLGRAADAALTELFAAEELAVIRAQFARGDQPPVLLRAPEKRAATAEDKLLVFMGISGGMGAGRIAALPLAGLGVAALNPIVLPVTIVLGLGAGYWMARTRKHLADKQHMRQWLSDALADARSTLDQLVSEQLIDAEGQLSLALDEALTGRIEAIEEELREVDKALKLDAAERSARQQAVARELADVTSARDHGEALLTTMRQLRDRG
ncbi:dynamin family protein [Kutzneria sp. CA-103260]|uniref:dynamin family protein n=1 Tax=Kutzneria sp. CA-103260 TaxID=2802641 RepID=UPI001BAD38C4|nr:dynamin family protein [Kutzneria sp. CA-103260]QUQ70104.1 dynamin [Kutzneria sp. CA-103260]